MGLTRIVPTPISHIGWGAVEQLRKVIEQFDDENILVIADPVLKHLGIVDRVMEPLAADHKFDIYTGVVPEPLLQTGQDLVDFARKGSYTLVIGIGGGSALDLAKLAAVFMDNEGNIEDYLNLTGSRTLQNRGVPKILIPTTAGTGAEVTNISVLALKDTKDVISHDFLIADVAIVDPQLTVSVPPKVTAATGADALTHAIEAYISVNANHYSDGLALQAIKLISGSLAEAVHDGHDQQARTDMAYGSYLAGLAFSNAGVGAIHALAYPIGGQFHVPHGDSNAVLIPYVMRYIKDSCAEKMARIGEAMGINTTGLNEQEAAQQCILLLVNLLREIGIPSTLGGFNIPSSALEQLTTDAAKQRRLLDRCPRRLNAEDISTIYSAAFSGKFPDQQSNN